MSIVIYHGSKCTVTRFNKAGESQGASYENLTTTQAVLKAAELQQIHGGKIEIEKTNK